MGKKFKMVLAVLGVVAASVTVPALAAASPAAGTARPEPAARPGGVAVEDVTIKVAGQGAPVHAWLVRPDGDSAPRSRAGVVFLHWLGQINSDRSEYLAEAVSLARRGAVSILPDGTFPYTGDGPVGTEQDVASVRGQEAAFRAAFDALLRVKEVDPARVALVGHDYGAMYGSLIAASEPSLRAAVFGSPDATWGDWFLKFFGLSLTGDQATAYAARFSALDPVNNLAGLGSRLMLQFGTDDFFVDAATRATLTAAAPQAQVKVYQGADHQLTDQAKADRDAFLAARLGLSSS
jgi:dienelactone hydrolase